MQNEKRAETRSWKGEDLCVKYRPYFERREAVCSKDIGFCRFFNQKNSCIFRSRTQGVRSPWERQIVMGKKLTKFQYAKHL